MSWVARLLQVVVVVMLGGLGLFSLVQGNWPYAALFLGAMCLQIVLLYLRIRRTRQTSKAGGSRVPAPLGGQRAVFLRSMTSVFNRSAAAAAFVVTFAVAGLAFRAIPAGAAIAVLALGGIVLVVSLYMRSFYGRAVRRHRRA
jgi:hypothetical protein